MLFLYFVVLLQIIDVSDNFIFNEDSSRDIVKVEIDKNDTAQPECIFLPSPKLETSVEPEKVSYFFLIMYLLINTVEIMYSTVLAEDMIKKLTFLLAR